MTQINVLFEDAHIIVAEKPYGVLSEAHEKQANLPAMLRDQCGCTVYPVHRLDKTTHGLIVVAKTRDSAAKLSAMLRQNEIEKIYLAVVEGTPDEKGEMEDLLYFDRSRGKSYVVKRERRGVKPAKLVYRRLDTRQMGDTAVSLVRVRLLTGRTHQIRVQFASRKMPLVGDRRYGSHIPAEHIALCAAELSFPHPITGEDMRFRIVPDDGVFGQIN